MFAKRARRNTSRLTHKPTLERLDRREVMAGDIDMALDSAAFMAGAEGEEQAILGVSFRTAIQGQPIDPLAIPASSRFDLIVEAQDLRPLSQGVFAISTELMLGHPDVIDFAIGEIQALTFTQAFNTETFTLTFEGQTTVPIPAPTSLTNPTLLNATAFAIENALRSVVGLGNISVFVDDELAPAQFLLHFTGDRIFDDVPAVLGGFSQVPGAAVVDNYEASKAARSSIIKSIIRTGSGFNAEPPAFTDSGSVQVGAFSSNIEPQNGGRVPVIIIPLISKSLGTTTLSGAPVTTRARENLLFGLDTPLPSSAISTTPLALRVIQPVTDLGAVEGLVQRSESLVANENADWFKFTTLAPGAVTNQASIQFQHVAGDLELELYDSNQQLLARSATTNNMETVSLRNLPAGTFFLKVSGFSGATNPSYFLTINAPVRNIPSDAYEPNNSLANASDLGAIEGSYEIGNLTVHNSTDTDFYKIELKRTGTSSHSINLGFTNALGDLDLRLLNATGTQIAASETSQDTETISLAGRTAGIYYIQVVGASGATNPSYQLNINAPTLTVEPDHYEPNNSLATATPLSFASGVATEDFLTIHMLDNDWFQFSIPSTPTTAHFASIDFVHSAGDLDVELYNAEGVKLRESKTTRDQERIALAGLSTGNYFLKVLGNGSTTSPRYTLQVVVPTVTIASDAFEPNDSRLAASDLRIVSGVRELSNLSIHASGNDDWFRFETIGNANTAHFVGLVFDGSQGDIDFQLFDASGVLLATSATSNNWEIINLAGRPAGVYFARVYGYQNGTNPRYFMSMSTPDAQITADRFEANENLATATSLRTIEGERTLNSLSIHQAGDLDWYSFETTTAGTSTDFVALNFTNALGNLDLNLYDASGNLIRQSNSVGDGERVSLAGLSAGRYFVRVAGANASVLNPQYSLTIKAPENSIPPDRFEGNDSLATAFDLRALQGATTFAGGSIHASGNDDWYRFEILAPGLAQHQVEASFLHAAGDLDISLHNAAGAELASSRSNGNLERIAFNGLAAGVYYLKVAGFAGATNPNYSLSFTTPVSGDLIPDRFEPNNALAFATRLRNDGTNVTGSMLLEDLSISSSTDVDHYQFTTTATGKLSHSVSVSFNRANGALMLDLLNSSGEVIRRSDSGTGTELISLGGLPAGTYTLRVSGKADARTPYQLALDTPASPQTNQLDAWTIMVYMTASDLAEFAFSDLNELEQAAASLPGSVNIAVLWDQSAQLQQYPSGNGSQAAWGSVGRGFIRPDLDPSIVATSFELMGEMNTGDASTLTSFIDWASMEAPAEKYALISWNHGAGIYGSNFDNADATSQDNLRISEIAAAIRASRVPQLDMIAFDACLMAMAEVAYNLRTTTDVLVGAQEVVGAEGYNYRTALSSLFAAPYQVDSEQLASGIVSSYASEYAGSASGWDTQSAIRTSGIGTLLTALNSFSNAVSSLTTAQLEILATAFENAVSYSDPDFRDLGSIMSAIGPLSGLPGAMSTAATGVLEALDGVLVALTDDVRRSSGLSIFVPEGTSLGTFYQSEFSGFVAASGWAGVISRVGGVSGQTGGGRFGRSVSIQDWAEDNNLPATAEPLFRLSGAGIAFSDLSLHEGTDVDWFRFSIGATGQANNRIAVQSAATEAIRISLYNAAGTTLLRNSADDNMRSISLEGLPAGEYTVRVFSPTNSSIRKYSLTADAPVPVQTVSRLGDIGVREKAYPVGVVGNQISLPGLEIAAGNENWFAIDTPRLPGERWFSVTIAQPAGQNLTATIVNAAGTVISRSAGASSLLLGYLATGGAERYFLRIVNAGDRPAAFAVRINNLVETYADVTVKERLSSVLVDRLPLAELVSTLGNVNVSDPRFQWVDNSLRLRPGAYLQVSEQSQVFVRVEVDNALNTTAPVSFVLPVKVVPNHRPHHNASNPFNVNNDPQSLVTPVDALIIINALRRQNFNPAFRAAGIGIEEVFVDVTNDGALSTRDALFVINELHRRARGSGGEGEFNLVTSSSEQGIASQSNPLFATPWSEPSVKTPLAGKSNDPQTETAIALSDSEDLMAGAFSSSPSFHPLDSWDLGDGKQPKACDAHDEAFEQLLAELDGDLLAGTIPQ